MHAKMTVRPLIQLERMIELTTSVDIVMISYGDIIIDLNLGFRNVRGHLGDE